MRRRLALGLLGRRHVMRLARRFGHGVAADIEVELSYDALAAGTDTQLESALDFIDRSSGLLDVKVRRDFSTRPMPSGSRSAASVTNKYSLALDCPCRKSFPLPAQR